jgi:hypothetical protein
MIRSEDLRKGEPRELIEPLAYSVLCLVKTCRLALDGATADDDGVGPVRVSLEVTEALSGILVDCVEDVLRDLCRRVPA